MNRLSHRKFDSQERKATSIWWLVTKCDLLLRGSDQWNVQKELLPVMRKALFCRLHSDSWVFSEVNGTRVSFFMVFQKRQWVTENGLVSCMRIYFIISNSLTDPEWSNWNKFFILISFVCFSPTLVLFICIVRGRWRYFLCYFINSNRFYLFFVYFPYIGKKGTQNLPKNFL